MKERSPWNDSQSILLALFLLVATAPAQHPALAPASSTSIVVTSSTGVLRYSSILIHPGVTVRFVVSGGGATSPGTPAVVLCDGDAIIQGTLSVAGDLINVYPAGWVTTGTGNGGSICNSSFPSSSYYWPPRGGRHAGDYGTVFPFGLAGGSPGGYLDRYVDQGLFACGQRSSRDGGGQGGGTLVLVADGRIEVSGTVTADGHHQGSRTAAGSGGSILLRGHAGLSVLPGGSVTARGGSAPGEDPVTFGAPGYVRLDAWGSAPVVQGTVIPAPTVVELPHLRVVNAPQIGNACLLQVYTRLFSYTWLGVALQPGAGSTPFGELGLSLGGTFVVGVAPLLVGNAGDYEPRTSLQWFVPNATALIGVPLWIQGLTAVGNPPVPYAPRLTNTVPVVVQ